MKTKNISSLIITGEIGIGKTTLLKKILFEKNLHYTGFFTEKIIENQKIVGYKISEINRNSQTFAHINFESQKRFYHFGINNSVFEEYGVQILDRSLSSGKLIVLDELGVIEQTSKKFCNKIKDVFSFERPIYAIIQKRAWNFWNKLLDGKLQTIPILEINSTNRNNIYSMKY